MNNQAELLKMLITKHPEYALSSKITPAGELTADESLDVYRNDYYGRLFDYMTSVNSGLKELVGEEIFDEVLTNYIYTNPSKEYSLSNYGKSFNWFFIKGLFKLLLK